MRPFFKSVTLPMLVPVLAFLSLLVLTGVAIWAQDAPPPASPAAAPAIPPEIQMEFELGQCRTEKAQLKYQIHMLKQAAVPSAPAAAPAAEASEKK